MESVMSYATECDVYYAYIGESNGAIRVSTSFLIDSLILHHLYFQNHVVAVYV